MSIADIGCVKLEDGTLWANPFNGKNIEVLSTASRLEGDTLTRQEIARIARMAQGYEFLIKHPAMTLKEAQKKISMIRKAIKESPDAY